MEPVYPESSYESLEQVSPLKFRSVPAMIINCLTASFLFGFSVASINPNKDFIAIQFNWCPRDPLINNGGPTLSKYIFISKKARK
ncbi:hypothetical protein IE077_004226 [Cardiosporidium cionae]|uniref:Uncharacterized protein n=1 Tax=Cardiosporidium cionae TaxID=476202 RepID=A0ABQ7JDG5_9APIC|nr:hypothetical protein IE077_004226 [Cardiosporidium cionae]|eukprot:KAF8822052.1 hypothetical protein IE077_004226 [Cardiosporidium cionae]